MSVKIRITALDLKAADAVTGLGGALCDLCSMSSDDAHDLGELEEELMMSIMFEGTKELAATFLNEKGEVPTKPGDWNTRFGVVREPTVEKEVESSQALHLLLRGTDWILKVCYHEIAGVNHWSEASNMRDLGFIKQAKADVQQHLKERTGLKIAFPDSAGKGGRTTSENVCRCLLYDRETRDALLELVPERNREKLRKIIIKVAVALRVVSTEFQERVVGRESDGVRGVQSCRESDHF